MTLSRSRGPRPADADGRGFGDHLGVLWQVNEAGALGSDAPGSVPRLICPMH